MTVENTEHISEVVEMNKLNFDKPVVIGGFVGQTMGLYVMLFCVNRVESAALTKLGRYV